MPIPDIIDDFFKGGFIIVENGKKIEIKYDDIVRVQIRTTDLGPWIPDCFWVITMNNAREVIVENGSTEMMILLKELQALPGFKNEVVIKAMSCCSNDIFLAWERKT